LRNNLQTGLLSSRSAADWLELSCSSVSLLFCVSGWLFEVEADWPKMSCSSVSSLFCVSGWLFEVESSLMSLFSSPVLVAANSVSAMKIKESLRMSLLSLVKRDRCSLVPFQVSYERHSLTFGSLQALRSCSSVQDSIFFSWGQSFFGGTWYFNCIWRYLVFDLHCWVDPSLV
jgi:hypothetical protein